MAASATIANLVAKITGDDKEFQKSMGRVESRLKKLSGLSGQGGPLGQLGKTAQAFRAAPILQGLDLIRQGLQVVTAEAAEFERQFKVVQAITSGTGQDFAKLETQVVALSTSTEIATDSLLKATAVMGRAGFHAKDVGVALETIADLATASGVSTEIAANMAVRMLKSYGKEASELAGISDVLAKAAASANVTIRGLAEGFKFTGAIAQQQGISFNDVTTALSLLGETGLEAGLAGRALQAMIMDLAKPTDNAVRELTKLGVVTHDASGKALPLAVILRQLKEAGMSSAQAFTIFNRNSARAVTALTRNVDAFDEFLLGLDESEGALDKQASTMRDSFNAELDRMNNLFTAIGKGIGDGLIGPARDALEAFNSLLGGIERLVTSKAWSTLSSSKAWMPDIVRAGIAAHGLMGKGGDKGGSKSAPASTQDLMGSFGISVSQASDAANLLSELLGISLTGQWKAQTKLEKAQENVAITAQQLISTSRILSEGSKAIQDKWDVAEILGKLDSFDLAQETKVAFGKILTKLKNDPTLVNMQGQAFENVKEAIRQYMTGAAKSLQAALQALEDAAAMKTARAGVLGASMARGASMGAQQFARFGGTVTKNIGPELEMFPNQSASYQRSAAAGVTQQVGGTFQNEKIFAALENDIINAASVMFEGMGGFILDSIEGFSPAELGAMGGILNTATSALGDLGGTINTFASVTAQTGNPMMGAAAALMDMITQTKSFEVLSIGLNTIFEALIGILDVFLEPLRAFGGLFHIIGVTIKALTPVLRVFQIGTEALMWIFKGVGYVLGGIVWAIAKVYNALADALETITFGLVDLQRMDANAVFDAIDDMDKLGDEARDTQEEFKKLNEELKKSGNIPAGFKTNLRAFQAALSDTIQVIRDTMGTGKTTRVGPQGELVHFQHGGVVPGVGFGDSVPAMLSPGEQVIPRGGVAGGVVIQNMVVQVSDTKDFMRKLTREQEWNSMVRRGTPLRGKPSGVR